MPSPSGGLEDAWVEPPEEIYTLTRPPQESPDEPAYVELDFEAGVPVRANGVEMSLLELIESLEIIAGAHGVGRIDVVENRSAGIKEREVYEAPAAVVLHTAHKELEKLVIPRDLERVKHDLSRIYADLVYSGDWFSHTRETIDAFVAAVQPRVTGSVRLKLFKGDCRIVGRKSPNWHVPSGRDGGRIRRPSDGASLVGQIRGRTGRRPVRVRRIVPVRSPALRRRRDGQRGVGRSDPRGGRAVGGGSRGDHGRARGDSRARAADPAFFDADAAKDDEDVHSFVERELVARVGEAGRRLHTGRSRNEQVALDLRLYLKRRVPLLQQAIEALIQVLGDQAVAAGDAVMPSYTHLRRAQPVLVAHFFLAHTAALRRDHAPVRPACSTRSTSCRSAPARLPGPATRIDVPALAARLGFSRIVPNSIDATGDRDFVSSFLHAAALAMVHISRIAEDFILFTSEEFRFFELADTAATGSSLMPQKKNPDPLELVRGKSGRVIGRLAGWLATMKGLPIGYSKDLQEDKEAVFEAEDTLRGSIDAAATVVAGLTLNRSVTATAASGLLLATDVADYLVAKGVPFRDAHEIVGALVRRLVQENRSFEALTVDEWRAHSALFDADVRDFISPSASVARKRTPQSTQPAAVAAAISELRAWLEAPRCQGRRQKVKGRTRTGSRSRR